MASLIGFPLFVGVCGFLIVGILLWVLCLKG